MPPSKRRRTPSNPAAPRAGVTAFFKVRKGVLAPAHFPSSNDMGAITVRYEVENGGAQRSVLRIDAVFVRDGQRASYFSDGTVEASEYHRIQELLPGFSLTRAHQASKAPPTARPAAPPPVPLSVPTPAAPDPVTPLARPARAAAPEVAGDPGLENTLEEQKAQLAAANSVSNNCKSAPSNSASIPSAG